MNIEEEGLITEILSRLPVKSLARFKLVNKRWYSLISDPQFAKIHLDICSNLLNPAYLTETFTGQMLALHCESSSSVNCLAITKLGPLLSKHDWIFLGTCHGLVALAYFWGNIFCLYNPATRQVRRLAGPPYRRQGRRRGESAPTLGGLGYDSSTDNYKLVIAYTNDHIDGCNSVAFEVDIFSTRTSSSNKNNNSSSSSWKRTHNNEKKHHHIIHDISREGFKNGSYSNDGCLHWLTSGWTIVSFDLATEQLLEGRLRVPHVVPVDGDAIFRRLSTTTPDYLCIYGENDEKPEAWVLVVMKDDQSTCSSSSSWSNLRSISKARIINHRYGFSPLWIKRDGKLLLCALTSKGPYICIYEPTKEDEEANNISNLSNSPFWRMPCMLRSGLSYFESLVSPGGVEANAPNITRVEGRRTMRKIRKSSGARQQWKGLVRCKISMFSLL